MLKSYVPQGRPVHARIYFVDGEEEEVVLVASRDKETYGGRAVV
jgi:hypothetical protein